MKIRFNRLISVLCAVMLLISAFSAWAAAESTPATPTDLSPVEENVPVEPSEEKPTEPTGESEEEPGDETVASVEVLITKTLTMGQSWEGKMKKTKPAVLKLDLNRPCSVYMLVEGKDVWATVEKSDRPSENPACTETDPETGRMVISWEAEEGSYLITLGPVEPNLLAAAKVTFMDTKAYEAWEAEQAEPEPEEETEPEAEPEPEEENEPKGTEPEPEEETDEQGEAETVPAEEKEPEVTEEETEPEEEPVGEPEEEQPEEEIQTEEPEEEPGQEETEPESEEPAEEELEDIFGGEDRSVIVSLTWDVNYPIIGDTAHLNAELNGYEGLEYTLQWQSSPDREQWDDVPEATGLTLDVVMTEENNHYFWRLVVYLEDETEEE